MNISNRLRTPRANLLLFCFLTSCSVLGPEDPSTEQVLLPGDALRVHPGDVNGPYEPGMDVALFLFEVQESTASFRTVQQVLAGTIRDRGGRIPIKDF